MNKMKKCWYYQAISIIAFLVCFTSCSSDDDTSYTNEEVEISNIEINILKEPNSDGVPSPRMVAKVDDWDIIEYTSDGLEHEVMTTLHFINAKEKTSMIIAGYASTVILYEYNPFNKVKSDTVIIAAEKQGYTCVATCLMNWHNNTYSTISETIFDDSSSSSQAATRAKDDFADIRAMFSKTLDKLSGDISNLSKYPSKFSKSAGAVAEIWTKVAIPWAKCSLYDGCPEIQEEIREKYALDRFKEYYWSLVPTSKERLYQKVKIVYNTSKDMFKNKPKNELTDEDITNISYGIATSANDSYQSQTLYGEEYLKYRVSAGVRSVDETSAVIYAFYTCMDGQPSYISEFGIDISGSNGKRQTIKVSNFDNDITIKGLTPGILYTARVYITSFGKRYESSFTFMTKIQFSLHPESLIFSQEGGTKVVALNIPEEGIKSWDIKSKPKWCEIEKGPTSFFVKVTETTEKRKGDIVVTAKLQDGSSVEAKLSVEQILNNWSGTKWTFKGSVNVSGNIAYAGNISMAKVNNFGIEIRDVERNDFTLSGDLAGMESSSRIYCDEENRLIWNYTESFPESGTSMKMTTDITFTRTSTTTANGKMNGSANVNVPGYGNINIGMNGDFSGNLISSENNQ